MGDSDVFYNAKASYNIGQSYKSSLLSIRIPGYINKQRLKYFITEMNRLFPELRDVEFYNALCFHFKDWGYINKSSSDQLYNIYW
ncbi:MAG: hypothetical protein IPP71_07035 [Bacteroidetes bacterium]|nr:hypothetical protein [Bacteroidota bacterium]